MKITPLFLMFGCTAAFTMMALTVQAKSSSQTEAFVRNASIAGEFEIESSQLALQKSQNPDIKSFAQTMITDHTKAAQGLKAAVVKSEAVDPSLVNRHLDTHHQKLLASLKVANGVDFDHKYAQDQLDGHKEAVTLFSNYAQDGDEPVLKDFAAHTLPTLKSHLKHAESLNQ